jgi:23S rRNA pseudouridine1911/1915/1917 synthase
MNRLRRLLNTHEAPQLSTLNSQLSTPMSQPLTVELIVEAYLSGKRIDSFLLRHLRNYTPFRMQRMVHAGLAMIDGMPVDLQQRVFEGQRVTLRLVEPPDKLLEPEPVPLDVLYDDPWLIVVNKPPGCIAHPVGEYQAGTLANAVQHYLDRRTPVRGLLRPGLVHRLDRFTSGVMVITKEHLSHRLLSIQFQNERITKSYLALVEGIVAKDEGRINLPIGGFPGGNSVLASAKRNAIAPRPAHTSYQVLERFDGYTWLRAKPRTGRLHQIRVHLAEIGHPVVDDEYYAAFGKIKQPPPKRPQHEGVFDDDLPELELESIELEAADSLSAASNATGQPALVGRHALHAHTLAFMHPITKEHLEFQAPLAADLQTVLNRLRGN